MPAPFLELLDLGRSHKLPAHISPFVNMISPLNCFPYDRVFRQIGDNNGTYTS